MRGKQEKPSTRRWWRLQTLRGCCQSELDLEFSLTAHMTTKWRNTKRQADKLKLDPKEKHGAQTNLMSGLVGAWERSVCVWLTDRELVSLGGDELTCGFLQARAVFFQSKKLRVRKHEDGETWWLNKSAERQRPAGPLSACCRRSGRCRASELWASSSSRPSPKSKIQAKNK